MVRQIFHMRKEKTSLRKIAAVLNAASVKTQRGGKWWPGTVKAMFVRILPVPELPAHLISGIAGLALP